MRREPVLMSALAALLALAALAIAAWTVATGQIQQQGLDALFLILVCLLLAAAFALVPFLAWRRGLLPQFRKKPAEEKPQTSSATAQQKGNA